MNFVSRSGHHDMIIDAWMQHPNAEWIGNPIFNSLRRWRPGTWSETAQPIQATLAEMDRASVSMGMLCAWHGPSGPMISNDEVAQHCRTHPDRFLADNARRSSSFPGLWFSTRAP